MIWVLTSKSGFGQIKQGLSHDLVGIMTTLGFQCSLTHHPPQERTVQR